jgi:CBS domain-containing protein
MNVNEAMTTPVKTCSGTTTLDAVARLMWEEDCGAIPVINDAGKPLGVVTDRDIAMAAMLNHRPLWDIEATTVIQGQRPVCSTQRDSIENCLTKMEQNGVRRVLVTDDSGVLSGIVSMGDAVAFTKADSNRKKNATISSEPVLGMLRKVSAHHEHAAGALIRAG